ncbi:MAG: TauD/TfdA family dioxygenase [Rhodospirillales bacterium]|nr:TauD/TfdA family dioxygenase [Rhodospirillales bacterium]
MMKLSFEPLHNDFGARVSGMGLSGDLSPDAIGQLRDAVDTYALLYFPDQDMTEEKQLAFTRLLGEPEAEHVTFGKTGCVKYFGTVGNVLDDGTKNDNAHVNTRYQTGNQLWHSDSSFRQVPSYVSILHAYEVPDEGGATEFASMRAAYARLPEDVRGVIDDLKVIHDYVFSRAPIAPVDPNHAASLPPVAHRLVRQNPGNGEKNYYVGAHARSIPGWTGIESRRLLDDLLQQATREQGIYAHQWQAGDTVIWDNRCLLHRGTGYDADRWRRRLQQTRVVGDERGEVPGQ